MTDTREQAGTTKPIDRQRLLDILENAQSPCVSVYTPIERGGPGLTANRIRMKNHVQSIESDLSAWGAAEGAEDAICNPIRELAKEGRLREFGGPGLAALRSQDTFECFTLPYAPPDLAIVGPRYHIKPLLPLLTKDARFHLLALARGSWRLYEGDMTGLTEVASEDLPRETEEVLAFDFDGAPVQFHTGAQGHGVGGDRNAVFHGQGEGTNELKRRLTDVIRKIEENVAAHLKKADARGPLVLCAAEPVSAIYHDVNTYDHLLDESLAGNPEHEHPETLHQQAWPIISKRIDADADTWRERFEEAISKDRGADDVSQIVSKAAQGTVESLWVASDDEVWGHFDPAEGVRLTTTDSGAGEDLLNVAAELTLRHGGEVRTEPRVKMPGQRAAAAILRF